MSQQSPAMQPAQSSGAVQAGPAARTGTQQPGADQSIQAGTGQTQPLFPSHNFLDEQLRTTSVQVLNQVLADVVVLRSHVKTAHWNVRGPDFYQLHELFDDVAEVLEGHVDEIAERATALGGIARGDVHDAVQRTTLAPMPPNLVEGASLIDTIAADIAQVDETLYWEMQRAEDLGDLDTLDLLNEVSRDVAKALWFVEAHLQGPGAAATQAVGTLGQGRAGGQTQGTGQWQGQTTAQSQRSGQPGATGQQQQIAQPRSSGQPQSAGQGQW